MCDCRNFDLRSDLDQALAAEVRVRLAEAIAQRGSAYLVVSGGSTPEGLFKLLAGQSLAWSKVTVVLADERWVPPGHEDSNERLVRTLLMTDCARAANFVSLIPRLDDTSANIAAISALLRNMPQFDVVLLGMGEDAHTASLFPCAPEIDEGLSTDASALITHPMNAPHRRVSLSRNRLSRTRFGVIHIVGDAKKSVYQQASESKMPERFPIAAFSTGGAFRCWWAP